jgi:hypothetical protein
MGIRCSIKSVRHLIVQLCRRAAERAVMRSESDKKSSSGQLEGSVSNQRNVCMRLERLDRAKFVSVHTKQPFGHEGKR